MKHLLNLSIFRRNRNFTFLFFGQFVSFFGTMITSVALPYQIYALTHSTLMVGLLSLVQLLPILITALVGGVFADRYHRRMLLLASESVLCLGSLMLALNASLAQPHIWVMFVVAALMSAFNGLHRPSLESMVQQIVAKDDFGVVSSLANLKYTIGAIAGPALGGVLIASVGLTTTYMADVLTFVASLTALFLMTNIPKPAGGSDDSTWVALMQGFRYAISRQELVGTYVVDFTAMIFGMPTALFPAVAFALGGAKVLGLLYLAPAVGALFISFYGNWATRFKRHGIAIAIAAAFWGVSIIGFGVSYGLSLNFWIAWFFLVLAGAFDGISGIFRMTMWNQTIPNNLRGRLAGIEMISYLSGPRLGDTEAGLVAAAFGVTTSIISGGVLCVAGVLVCCWLLPKFCSYNSDYS